MGKEVCEAIMVVAVMIGLFVCPVICYSIIKCKYVQAETVMVMAQSGMEQATVLTTNGNGMVESQILWKKVHQ